MDEHVLVGALGEDKDGAVSGCAPLPADERNQASQLSRRRGEACRGQRGRRGKVGSSDRTDAGTDRGVLVEGGSQQAAVGVNAAGVSSGVVGKSADRAQNGWLGDSAAS